MEQAPMTEADISPCDAVRAGNAEAVTAFLAQLEPTAQWPLDADGHTMLHWAAMSSSGALLALVVAHANSNRPVDSRSIAPAQAGQTPLHWACVAGNVDSVRILLSRGADPAAVDAKGYTAATHAVHYGRVDLLHLVLSTSSALVGVRDVEGHTLLQWAAYYDHHPVVAYLLLVWRVNPDAVDNTGMTALHRAAQQDRPFVAEVLLRKGADVHVSDADGKAPIDLAVEGSRTALLLSLWGKGVLTPRQPVHKRHSLPKYGLVLFYHLLLISSYLKYHSELISGVAASVGLNVLLHVCMVISFVSHLTATFADPGDIPKGSSDTLVSYIEKTLAAGNSEVALVPSAFCFTCISARPPRSKHSRERDRCVKLFDHECPWVNNTVGLHTHKPLLLLTLSTAIAQWLFIDVMIMALIGNPDVNSIAAAVVESPLICVLIMTNTVVSVFCVMLFLSHVRLVLRGQTTYEHLTATRDKATSNPYDFGAWKNLSNFLTSTGPGTGNIGAAVSVTSLQEVVLSSGRENVAGSRGHLGNKSLSKRPDSSTETNDVSSKLLTSPEVY